MEDKSEKIFSVEKLCEVIDMFSSSMDDYLYVFDFVNDFYYISKRALERFDLPSNSFHQVSEVLDKLVHPDDLPKLNEDIAELRRTDRRTHNMHYRWLSVEGTPIWINCRGYVVRQQGKALYMMGCINEIGERQKADNVSGLLGEASLKAFMAEFTEYLPDGFLLRLGLDDLKGINAELGVEYGDRVLRKTAQLLTECILPGQRLFRVYGDEFMVVDFLGGSREDAKMIYNRMRNHIEQFIESNDYEGVFTLSGGIIKSEDIHDCSFSGIMRLTEFAIDEAKRQGKNRCYDFSTEAYEKFLRKKSLIQQFRQSISHSFDGFRIFFQPIVETETARIIGAEALMRFQSREYGMVSPVEFIPILEETSLIIPAGRWVLRQALAACKRFQKVVPDFKISINVSPVQIMKSYLSEDVITEIQKMGITPSQVQIELTETEYLETDQRFIDTWKRLQEAGVLLALDDFGSGYSNFRYLMELRPDIIKTDRTFTMKVMENPFEYKLLSLFSEMAHEMGLEVCIEGVETEAELWKLRQLLPEYIQGYHFGTPCQYDEFMKLLVEN